jgi:hypothetical protein
MMCIFSVKGGGINPFPVTPVYCENLQEGKENRKELMAFS